MSASRSLTLARELAACDLIEVGQTRQAQAIIACLLFSNPELSDEQLCRQAMAHTGIPC